MDDLTATIWLTAGFVLLIAGAEVMVRYSSRLGRHYGLRPVIIGTTIVAFGTSAPEFLVSFLAAWQDEAGLAIGNAVGSNVANIGLVLGLSALVSPMVTTRSIVAVEYASALLASGMLVVLAWDGNLDRQDGIALALAFALFFFVYIRRALRPRPSREGHDTVETLAGRQQTAPGLCWLLTGVGMAMLLAGASGVTEGASALAANRGVAKTVIGATIVALGTSLPEVAASVVAAIKKEHELALGNVLGSNVFNMLFVLGPSAAFFGLPVQDDLARPCMALMLLVSVLLLPLLLTGSRLGRRAGLGLVLFYAGFFAFNAGSELGWFPLPDWALLR